MFTSELGTLGLISLNLKSHPDKREWASLGYWIIITSHFAEWNNYTYISWIAKVADM